MPSGSPVGSSATCSVSVAESPVIVNQAESAAGCAVHGGGASPRAVERISAVDRKSTRLNSSHLVISYAAFCLKKKKKATAARRVTAQTSAHAQWLPAQPQF